MAGTYDWYQEWNSPLNEGIRTPYHHKRPKLTPQQRQEIAFLRMEGSTARELALTYGVSAGTIYNITPCERP